MNRRQIVGATMFAMSATLSGAAGAASLVLDTAVPTLNLGFDGKLDGGNPQNIAWDPTNRQYYGATGGSWADSGYVWNATGSLLQAKNEVGIDIRALDYDPATGTIEAVTFDAAHAPAPDAIVPLTRDAGGLITGFGTPGVLPVMPGLPDAQTAPAYDAAAGLYYSLGSQSDPATSGVVNVVSRATGGLTRQITLDLARAGGPSLQGEYIGFDSAAGALIGLDAAHTRALVFSSRDGSFLGGCALPSIPTGSVAAGFGYAHGQLFVFDGELKGYRGFDVLNPAPVPEPSTVALFAVGGLAMWGLRRRRETSAPA